MNVNEMKAPVDGVELVDFSDEYAADFARINKQWIEKLFKMEAADTWAVEHPEKIIEDGGYIVMAKLGDRVVGTGALIFVEDGTLEIAKMGVDEDCRGYGVGDKVIKQLVRHAKERTNPTIHTLKIETNSALKNAIHLYRKNGFVDDDITVSPHGYDRADVWLRMSLQ